RNRWVALDPAYPPLAGEPLMAAPLLTTITLLPGGSGFSSAARSQVKVILTSVCQLTENVSHVWSWSGPIPGLAPATRMSTSGSYWFRRLHATVSSAASATSVQMVALVVASSARAGPVRATANTGAPASENAREIPRPKPLLSPTTTVVLSDKSLMIVLFLCMAMVRWRSLLLASLAVVLVVAAGPGLPCVALILALGRPVQDRVVAHQELDPTPGGRIGLVDDAVLEGEDTHQRGLRQITNDVGPGRGRVLGHDRRQPVRRGQLAGGGGAQGEGEVGVRRRDPGNPPAHPPPVGLQLGQRRPRHQHQGHIPGLQVRKQGVQGVGDGGVDRVAGLVAGDENEVVDQQLGAAVEQLGQGPGSVVGVEAVGLVDRDPGQLPALERQLVAHPGVGLLALEQLVAGGLPLLRADNLVLGHCVLSPFESLLWRCVSPRPGINVPSFAGP